MINLIPPEIKQLKGLKSVIYVATLSYFILASILVLGLAGLATYTYTQKIALGDQRAELDRLTAEKDKVKPLLSEAAFVQNRVKSAATYKSGSDWNIVLDSIARSTPTNTRLTSIKLTGDESKPPTVTIGGESVDRRSIILFKDKLALTKPFTSASLTALNESATKDTKAFTFSISVSITKK